MNKKILITLSLVGLIFCFGTIDFVSAQPKSKLKDALTYENYALGIKFTGPEGWYIAPSDQLSSRGLTSMASKSAENKSNTESITEKISKRGQLVGFFKYPLTYNQDFNPRIMVSMQQIRSKEVDKFKNSLDVAKYQAEHIKTWRKDRKIIKEATPITVNGVEGAYYSYEGRELSSATKPKTRTEVYVFLKYGRLAYAITFIDKVETFEKTQEEFKAALKKFVLLDLDKEDKKK